MSVWSLQYNQRTSSGAYVCKSRSSAMRERLFDGRDCGSLEQGLELLAVDVAAAEDGDGSAALAGRGLAGQQRREAGRAGGLDEHLGAVEDEAQRVGDLVVGDED